MKQEPKDSGRSLSKNLAFSLVALIGFLILLELLLQLAGLFLATLRDKETKPGAKVIVCIGDSNTYGLYVKAEEAYPAQLEKLIQADGKNYQVINLGAPGQNSSEILRDLPGIFKKYHPSALVVMVGVNNRWNVAGQEQSLFEKFFYNLKLYKLFSVIYFRGIKQDSDMIRTRRDTGEIIVHRGRGYIVSDDKTLRDIQRRFIQDMVKIIEYCRANNVAIVLMTYAGDRTHNYEVPNGLTRQVAKKMNVPMVDNYALFDSRLYDEKGNLNFELRNQVLFEDIHPKPLGYLWIAENLYEILKKEKIVE